ncbi:MAG: DUF6048 family protein [Flavobacterium circumlabens]|uniref:Outer membrane protein beta-barrel domain-containing protein n=1 Tax=Flavobacterium circumlabens TaxID=2133765 RepID=A0A4Y7UDV3_9FLAO|nr:MULTISPECIES: DUF6048 family protein [Flavobacterium]QSB25963.1 hypothetical protein HAV12_016465 [Flavobacterium sp. CLA17]TCN52066.1 hypothetical protein EV142_111100 [Flavobacterium circumlabens]TEB44633.1 hypothetical protein D0809_05380 [Flavobacterium circumlabens]
MKHILKYFFSIPLLFSMFLVHAQETVKTKETAPEKPKSEIKKPAGQETATDTILPKTNRYGLRVGVDLYKLTRGFYDKDYKGVEFVGDFRLTKKYYLAAELGFEDKTTDDDRLNSTATGTYIKGGFDYNTYQNWLDMENLITIGLRGGFSTFSQQLNTYKIYNPNPYWGQQTPIVSGEKYNGLTAAWLEVAMGLKAKVFNNVFVGFGVQLKLLVSNKEPGNFENLYIPGFNRTYDGNFGVGFNYTVSYFIPLYKKKVIVPELKNVSPKK